VTGEDGAALLAFDLGGTRLIAGLVAEKRNGISGATVEDIAGRDADYVVATVGRVGRDLVAGRRYRGVGLCAPGLISTAGSVLSLPGKLEGLEGFDLARWLTEEFGVPAVVVNDAIAHGVGEACAGAGKNYARVVVITIGTGVGASVVQDGEPLTGGPLGGGTMGGHIPISEKVDGFLDSNGRPDTIEAHCCARRIVDYANECGEAANSVPDVYEAYKRGSDGAAMGIEVYKQHLVRAVVALAHAHAPDVVVLGGGAMTPGNPIVDGIEPAVNDRLFGTYRIDVSVAELGEQAALWGLGHLHRRRYVSG
jgi:glucokinase